MQLIPSNFFQSTAFLSGLLALSACSGPTLVRPPENNQPTQEVPTDEATASIEQLAQPDKNLTLQAGHHETASTENPDESPSESPSKGSGESPAETSDSGVATDSVESGDQDRSPGVVAEAETALASGQLTLADCLVLAVAQNRDYQIALSNLTSSDLQRVRSRAQVYAPTFDAEYRIIKDQNDTAEARAEFRMSLYGFDITPFIEQDWSQYGAATDNNDSYDTRAGISVRRRLLAFAENRRKQFPITQADTRYHIQQNQLQESLRDLLLNITQAFYRVQRIQARVAVRETRLSDAEAFVESVRQNIAFGFTPASEEANAVIDLSRAESALVSERAQLLNSIESLLSDLDRELTDNITLVDEDVENITIPARDLEVDIELVTTQHEDVINQLHEIDLTQSELAFADDNVRPDVTLQLEAAQVREGTSSFDDNIDRDTDLSVTIGVSFPLDGWRDARAQRERLREELRRQRISLKSTTNGLELRLRRLYRRIEELRQQVDLAIARRAAEEERLNGFLARYENGEITNLEVTRAKSSLIDAELSLLDARIDLVLADTEYESILPTRAEALAP